LSSPQIANSIVRDPNEENKECLQNQRNCDQNDGKGVRQDYFGLRTENDHQYQQEPEGCRLVEFVDEDVVEIRGAFLFDDQRPCQDPCDERDDHKKEDAGKERAVRYRISS